MTRSIAVASILAFVAPCVAGDPAPKSPLECRQRVLAEIERFRKMKGPEDLGGGDEHIARATLRHFAELKDETTLILAFAGNKDAVNELVKQYGLEQPSCQRWIDERHVRYPHGRTIWDVQMFHAAQIMDLHRPELAKRMRDEMRRLAIQTRRPVELRPNFERMTFKELKQAARAGETEAMRRWASLDLGDAAPFLVERMTNKDRSPYEKSLAAEALAMSGDERGLAWLRQEARNPAGSSFGGTCLLRSGEPGRKVFLELVKEYEGKKADLPQNLIDAPLHLNVDLYCKLLPRLSQVKDRKFRYNLDHAAGNHVLPAETLTFLIDQVRKDDRKHSHLIGDISNSIRWNGVADTMARDVAQLWADELLQTEEVAKWEWGASLFIQARLGSKEIAAAGARRQLKKRTDLAVQILAEAGRAEDALSIWTATHEPRRDVWTRNWYTGPSLGWFATVRLTNHLAAPK